MPVRRHADLRMLTRLINNLLAYRHTDTLRLPIDRLEDISPTLNDHILAIDRVALRE